jgi:hypothetical protein
LWCGVDFIFSERTKDNCVDASSSSKNAVRKTLTPYLCRMGRGKRRGSSLSVALGTADSDLASASIGLANFCLADLLKVEIERTRLHRIYETGDELKGGLALWEKREKKARELSAKARKADNALRCAISVAKRYNPDTILECEEQYKKFQSSRIPLAWPALKPDLRCCPECGCQEFLFVWENWKTTKTTISISQTTAPIGDLGDGYNNYLECESCKMSFKAVKCLPTPAEYVAVLECGQV